MAAHPQITANGALLKDIKDKLGQVHGIFTRYNDPNQDNHPTQEEKCAALYILRSILETLGKLEGTAVGHDAKQICREARHLRNALVHGAPQIDNLPSAIFRDFANGIFSLISPAHGALDDPTRYRDNTGPRAGTANFLSACGLYQSLQAYGGVEQSLQQFNPDMHVAQLRNLAALSGGFANGNALAYCWSSMLEAIVRLQELEPRYTTYHARWRKTFAHAFDALSIIDRNFLSARRTRAFSGIHSDIEEGLSPFARDPKIRKIILETMHNFLGSVDRNKNATLKEIADRIAAGGEDNYAWVAGHPLTSTAQLSAIVVHTNNADTLAAIATNWNVDIGTLTAIVNHVAHGPASDTAVVNNNNTLTADLATITARTLLATDLEAIAKHRNVNTATLTAVVNNAAHNDASDTAVANNANTLAADLTTIAVRSAAAHQAVLANPNTNTATLNWFLTTYGNYYELLVAAHPNTSPPVLTAIATSNPASHPAIAANPSTPHTTLSWLLTAGPVHYPAIARNPGASTAHLSTIATRTNNPDTLASIAANRNADAGVLAVIVHNARHNAASDSAVVANNHTSGANLLTIAGRASTPAAALIVIAGHQNVNAAALAAVVNNANHSPASDSAVVANAHTPAASLAIIAGRTQSEADLHHITIHHNQSAALVNAVVGNDNTAAADLTTIAANTADPAVLARIAAHPNADAATLTAVVSNAAHDPASDSAVIANRNTIEADLVTIAARTLVVGDLQRITAHRHRGPASDAAVVGNNLTRTADLVIIRTRATPALQGLIDAHPNAPIAQPAEKKKRI